MRSSLLLLPSLALTLALIQPAEAQTSAFADTGVSYRNKDNISPGRSPFMPGPGTFTLADGTSGTGELHLTARDKPELLIKSADGRKTVNASQVREFTIEGHRYVPAASVLKPDDAKNVLWLEALMDETGPWHLYQRHGAEHTYLFINSATRTKWPVKSELPFEGYDDEYDSQLRAVLAIRPDIAEMVDGHQIRVRHLPGVTRALNSGERYAFK